MDKANQKILTISFVTVAILVGASISLLLKTFAASFGFIARINDIDAVKHGLPVIIGLVLFLVLQFNQKVLAWGDGVALEIRKVVWPSRKDATAMTVVVVIMVLISALVITTFDFVSGYLINYVLR